jgi:hypothetical protein
VQEPTVLRRVRVRGRDEVFLISQVYHSLGVVDVVPLGHDYIVEQVAFESLEEAEEETQEGMNGAEITRMQPGIDKAAS